MGRKFKVKPGALKERVLAGSSKSLFSQSSNPGIELQVFIGRSSFS
jgi:hypothetical protein